MSREEYRAREAMRLALDEMVEIMRGRRMDTLTGKLGTITAVWRRCYRLGLTIDEDTFNHWLSPSENRMVPLLAKKASGRALMNIGVATQDGDEDRYLVDPAKFIAWCKQVPDVTLPMLAVIYKEDGAVDHDDSDPLDVALMLEMERMSVRGYRAKLGKKDKKHPEDGGDPPMSNAELMHAMESAHRRVMPDKSGSTMNDVPLPNDIDTPAIWLPWASAPATVWWTWRWSTPISTINRRIRTYNNWATDWRFGMADLRDAQTLRWTWQNGVMYLIGHNDKHGKPVAMHTVWETLNQPDLRGKVIPYALDKDVREHMVKLMHSRVFPETDEDLFDWDAEFASFYYAMEHVKEKVHQFKIRKMALIVDRKALRRWFEEAEDKRLSEIAGGTPDDEFE